MSEKRPKSPKNGPKYFITVRYSHPRLKQEVCERGGPNGAKADNEKVKGAEKTKRVT